MTESEWLTWEDPELLLGEAGHTGRLWERDRKLRLVACACCRLIWDLFREQRSRQAIRIAELYAEGIAGWEEVVEIRAGHIAVPARSVTMNNARQAAQAAIWKVAQFATHHSPLGLDAFRTIRIAEANLIRDIFGNPFRPVVVEPAWFRANEGAVAKLVQVIEEEQSFAVLPILADALEEAGCGDTQILEHCRGPGPHARGCWLVDQLREGLPTKTARAN